MVPKCAQYSGKHAQILCLIVRPWYTKAIVSNKRQVSKLKQEAAHCGGACKISNKMITLTCIFSKGTKIKSSGKNNTATFPYTTKIM
jgi:hypothetical protein